MYKKRLLPLLILTFNFCFIATAQKIEPEGKFLSDSIKIGVPVPYSLSVRYPSGMDIVFPDTLYDFSPFELEEKIFFPTESDSTTSLDSAVYLLTSFEIDKIQRLQLPVFIIEQKDSTEVYAQLDSLVLEEMIQDLPDSISLKSNSNYMNVPLQFNYPYLLIGLGIFLFLTILALVLFGSKILKAYKLYRLKQSHIKFLDQFDKLITDGHSNQPEPALLAWKNYLEKLLAVPYTKLTTKEIIKTKNGDSVASPLQAIDRVIYGNAGIESLQQELQKLRDYCQNRYQQKTEEIRNG